jgi:hypothetical protein
MGLLQSWTDPSWPLLHEPWVPDWFRDGLAELISELELAQPRGLAAKRNAFRNQGQLEGESPDATVAGELLRMDQICDQLLRQWAELLVGVQLLRARVLTGMPEQTPDFECCWGGQEFGVEVSTRTRQEAGAALHNVLEQGLCNRAECVHHVEPDGKALFSVAPENRARIGGRLITEITKLAAGAGSQPVFGNLAVPGLELCVLVRPRTAG